MKTVKDCQQEIGLILTGSEGKGQEIWIPVRRQLKQPVAKEV